jgi:hypothetical protein
MVQRHATSTAAVFEREWGVGTEDRRAAIGLA